MNIYLVRHAKAEKGYKDFYRELSEEGIERFNKTLKFWEKHAPQIDYIFSSPLIRTKQTAELIRTKFDVKNAIILENDLQSSSTSDFIITIANSMDAENLVFVGHQPDISYHASNLVSNTGSAINFHPGTIAKISFVNSVQKFTGNLDFLIYT